MKYAVWIECKEAKSTNGEIMTQEGTLVLIVKGEWGDTSHQVKVEGAQHMYSDARCFGTKEAAIKFAKKWKGHPWYFMSNGNFKIVKIKPLFKQVRDGYEVVEEQ